MTGMEPHERRRAWLVIGGFWGTVGLVVTVDSLWGIDLMVDSPEAVAVSDTGTRWYRVTDLPPGYLGDVARELLVGVARQLGKPDLTSGQEMRR